VPFKVLQDTHHTRCPFHSNRHTFDPARDVEVNQMLTVSAGTCC